MHLRYLWSPESRIPCHRYLFLTWKGEPVCCPWLQGALRAQCLGVVPCLAESCARDSGSGSVWAVLNDWEGAPCLVHALRAFAAY